MKLKAIIAVAVAMCLPIFAQAQTKPEITKMQAEKAAMTAVKGGKVVSAEYEHEAGKYIWSLDVKTTDGETKEVWVDPMTGKVAKASTENPAQEKKEKMADMKTAKITQAQAEKIALKAVPGGKVSEAELEHESGMFIWSLDVKVGKTNKEVWINPQSGKVEKVFTESAGKEQK